SLSSTAFRRRFTVSAGVAVSPGAEFIGPTFVGAAMLNTAGIVSDFSPSAATIVAGGDTWFFIESTVLPITGDPPTINVRNPKTSILCILDGVRQFGLP